MAVKKPQDSKNPRKGLRAGGDGEAHSGGRWWPAAMRRERNEESGRRRRFAGSLAVVAGVVVVVVVRRHGKIHHVAKAGLISDGIKERNGCGLRSPHFDELERELGRKEVEIAELLEGLEEAREVDLDA